MAGGSRSSQRQHQRRRLFHSLSWPCPTRSNFSLLHDIAASYFFGHYNPVDTRPSLETPRSLHDNASKDFCHCPQPRTRQPLRLHGPARYLKLLQFGIEAHRVGRIVACLISLALVSLKDGHLRYSWAFPLADVQDSDSWCMTGLLPLLKSIHRPSELKRYAGDTLGVDGYGWLHRGAVACAIELAQGKPTRK